MMGATTKHRASPVAFRFSNIEPVEDAELRLGDLTVIAGRNNTGKTYIAYSLYGFLKSWMSWLRAGEIGADFPQICAISDGLRDREQTEVLASPDQIADQRMSLSKKISGSFSLSIGRVFSSNRDNFKNATLQISFAQEVASLLPSESTVSIQPWNINLRYNGVNVTASLKCIGPTHNIISQEAVSFAYYVFLLRDLFPIPFVLSPERLSISLFYKELDFTKNRIIDLLHEHLIDRSGQFKSPFNFIDRVTNRYALSIKDNIDFTRGIPDYSRDRSPLSSKQISCSIENMMAGHFRILNDEVRFVAKNNKYGEVNIPLHLASSSARGLADLYFFLEHSAVRGQLLIIDTPESHLDTANQILFARFIVKLLNVGIRVMVTTHSDYIIKELNNLIMLSRDFADKEEVASRLRYRSEDELHPERVQAYVAGEGSLTECRIGPFGIAIPVFDNTIDAINESSFALSARMDPEN